MMKYIFSIISIIFMSSTVFANVHIQDFENVLKLNVDEQHRLEAASVYRDEIKDGHGISVAGICKVCVAAGWDIEQQDGKRKCDEFVYFLLNKENVQYYEVCGKDKGKSGGTEYCVDKPFNWINVQLASAVTIAQEYARVKYNDSDIQCSNLYRKEENDDWIKCISRHTNKFYEFKFDDVRESKDSTVQEDIVQAICESVYDVPKHSWWGSVYCDAGEAKCKQIQSSLNKFGYKATSDGSECKISFGTISKREDLHSNFGIDPFVFCREIQVDTNIGLINYLNQYVASKANVSITKVRCNTGAKEYTGGGCHDGNDDVISCYVGDKQVDFVFDDVNELVKKRANAGMQGVACLTADGQFDGASCMLLGEEQCNKIKTANAKECPGCSAVEWDAEHGLCVLPDAKTVQNFEKSAKLAGTIVGVGAGVALTVVTAGAFSGVMAGVFITGGVIAAAGGTVAAVSEGVMDWGVYTNDFKSKVNTCVAKKETQCAKDLITEYLQKMQSYAQKKSLTEAEAKTIDGIFATLFKQIPYEDDFWEFLDDPEVFQCNSRGDCTIKIKEQGWQQAYKWGNIAQIVGGVMQLVAVAGQAIQVTKVLKEGQTVRAQLGKNAKGTDMLREVGTMNKGGSTYVTNKFIEKVTFNGKTFAKNSELAAEMIRSGYKTGDIVTLTAGGGKSLFATVTATGLVWAPVAGASAIEEGIRGLASDGENMPFVVRRATNEELEQTSTIVPTPVPIPAISEQPTPGANSEVAETTNETFGVSQVASPTLYLAEQSDSPSGPSKIPTPQNNKKTALVATVAVGGAIGVGALIAGLVVASDKNKTANSATVIGDACNMDYAQLDELMALTRGIIGNVDDSPLEIVSIPTTVNTDAPFVQIDNMAVIVISYKKHNIPFYMNGKQWVPLLGIAPDTKYFNTYPNTTKSNIKTVDKIASILDYRFLPSAIAQYTGTDACAEFPSPSQRGYDIINAEFKGNVVHHADMDKYERAVYESNLNQVRALLQ